MRSWRFHLFCLLAPQLSFDQLRASQLELQRIEDKYKSGATRTFVERLFYRAYPPKFARHTNTYGAALVWQTRFGEGALFPHGFNGIHIAHEARFGRNCVILQQVTVGVSMRSDRTLSSAPIIGSNVLLGAGAKIIGNCVIGDGARIGAGVVLTNVTIPPGAVIVNKSAYDLTNKRYIYPQH